MCEEERGEGDAGCDGAGGAVPLCASSPGHHQNHHEAKLAEQSDQPAQPARAPQNTRTHARTHTRGCGPPLARGAAAARCSARIHSARACVCGLLTQAWAWQRIRPVHLRMATFPTHPSNPLNTRAPPSFESESGREPRRAPLEGGPRHVHVRGGARGEGRGARGGTKPTHGMGMECPCAALARLSAPPCLHV